MAETKESIREDRSKRINKNKDTNNLIADNGLDGKVIDVYDVLNRFSDPVIIKLRKLREYGISDEMIAESYADMTGNVENEETAIDALAVVFRKLALYINQQPNGIVLDLTTGDINKEASYRQAVRVGITDDVYYERFEKMGKKAMIEDFSKLKETAIKEEKYIINSSKEIGKIFDNSDFKRYLEKNPELLNLSPQAKEILKESRNRLATEDPNLMELYKIEIEIDKASGTPMHEALLKEKERFLKAHPRYRETAQNIRDENKNIKPDILSKYNDYNKDIKINYLFSEIAMAKDKDLNSLSPTERKVLITSALAGLRISSDAKEKWIVNKECWSLLKSLNPEISNGKNGIDKDKLYSFLEKELQLEEKLTPEKFKNLLQISSEAVDKTINLERYKDYFKARKFIAGKAKKIADKIFNKYFADPTNVQEINFQEELEKIDKTPLELYFSDSKIKFSKKDEREFNEIYQDCTVESWIDNKDSALALRYASLVRTREKLSQMPNTEYYNKKREEIENGISEFKAEHPNLKFEKDDGTLLDDINDKAENYQNKMIESALLKFYSLDVLEHNEKNTKYNELSDDHKKAYLRNVIVGLKYGEQSNNKSILKMAQRRLELLNTSDKTFIDFDQNGNPIISEKQILDEYNSMSKHNYQTYEELEFSSEERKDAYLLKKLEEYSKLRDDQFIKLENPKDKKKSLEQIEKIKESSNEQGTIYVQEGTANVEQGDNESVIENNSSSSIYQAVEETEVKENKKTNWLQRRIATFKNLFKPRLTDGMAENAKEGFFSRIFNKLKPTDVVDAGEPLQNVISNQKQKNKPKNNEWTVEGVTGKVDENKLNRDKNQEQRVKAEEQDGEEH